jgi:tripeptidyl-peptidase-2
MVDVIDASGSGDVDTSTVRTTEGPKDREVEGLSGRSLKIPDDWENPSGEWHVGVKPANQLLPSILRGRLESDYMTKQWEPVHNPILAQAVKELADFNTKHPNSGEQSLVRTTCLWER